MQLLTDTMKTNVIIIIVMAPLVKKVGYTLAFKVIQVSRWNVDRARLVRPLICLLHAPPFTCTLAARSVFAQWSLQQVSHLILHANATCCDFVVSEYRHQFAITCQSYIELNDIEEHVHVEYNSFL